MEKIKNFFIALGAGALVGLPLVIALVIAFLIVSFLTWLVCWAFALPWNWAVPIGIYACIVLVRFALAGVGK